MSEFHGGFGYLYSMSRDCAVVFYLVYLGYRFVRADGLPCLRIAVVNERCTLLVDWGTHGW